MALESIALAKLFVNEMLTKVEHVGAAQLQINPLPNKDDYSVETKIGPDGVSRQIKKKTKVNMVEELLHGIKKSLFVLKVV